MRSTSVTLLSLLAAAAAYAQDEAASSAPPETVSIIYVALFGLVFIGMIVGFFVYLFWRERDVKAEK
jgi:heme/copper-type cytochrome/quinol oxidase subunit 2